ncbi:MAG: CDP-alcohol phosphatidyltransferase family protein, partial [Chthoniobacterales bacterium]
MHTARHIMLPEPTSRRPLKSRDILIFQKLAARLAKAGVRADAISAAGLLFGLASGAVIAATFFFKPPVENLLWLAGGILVQLRLLSNMLDGMVAVEGGQKSKFGPLWNEIPDRLSDSATLIGLGYATGGVPQLGWLAALLAMFTAYIRAIGASNGAGGAFLGWCSKPRRMFLVTLACIAGAAGFAVLAIPIVLWLIVAGCVWTCAQRINWIAHKL